MLGISSDTFDGAVYRDETPFAYNTHLSISRLTAQGNIIHPSILDATPFLVGLRLAEVRSTASGRVWTVAASGDIVVEMDTLSLIPTRHGIVLAVGSGEITRTESLRFGGKVCITGEIAFTPESASDWLEPRPTFGDVQFQRDELLIDDHPEDIQVVQAAKAMTALEDVTRWLSVSQSRAAELCHVSVRTVQYWRGKTNTPRPSSVRRLYEVHALLKALVDHLGQKGAADWLREPLEMGRTRLQALESDGPTVLLRDASLSLFERVTQPERPVLEAEAVTEANEWVAEYEPTERRKPVRRLGKVPPQIQVRRQ